MSHPRPRHLAVVGAGWAGLAAAVRATQAGHRVSVFEMAPHPGGRARSVDTRAGTLDNGQHILIGAYTHTLALMREVGADPQQHFMRMPLRLLYPDGRGLSLPPGGALSAFARGVLATRGWRWPDRLALLAAAAGWLAKGFRCAPDTTVAELCARLPHAVRVDLIEPLCVAALNTPMDRASGVVFLRVLKDALFSGPGSADLLLPRQPLSALLPVPARAWLARHGSTIETGHRVQRLVLLGPDRWAVDGQAFDGVVLACSAVEASRLAAEVAPAWSALTAALRYEPIVTAYLHDRGLQFPAPMMALQAHAAAPAQFAFDLGALGFAPGLFAFVVSGARPWVDQGLSATAKAVLAQAREAFAGRFNATDALRHIAAEQRATFACTPRLQRPPMALAPGLLAAGDYVDGPYPATLEGAVRAAERAADTLLAR